MVPPCNPYAEKIFNFAPMPFTEFLKKVDQAKILGDNKTLKLYDPLWEGSIRHHMRTIKINTQTGIFRADMQVELINDGPITIIIEK